jgi:outer membrane protein assembly factor BamB
VAVVGAVLLILTGCWPTPGAGPDRRSFNPFERTLTRERVPELTELFRAPLPDGTGPPVASPAGLFVRTGPWVAAFDPRTGSPRWTERLLPEDTGPYEPETSEVFILDHDRVMATYTVFGASHVRNDHRVTYATGTGAREEGGSWGVLQSLRGPDMAVVAREQCCFGVDITSIRVASVLGGTGWGGVAAELTGGVASLGTGRLFVTNGSNVLAYDTTTACPPRSPQEPVPSCTSDWIRPLRAAAGPVVIGDDDTVYVGLGDGYVYALNARTGGVRWWANPPSEWQTSLPVTSAPALADGVLYAVTAEYDEADPEHPSGQLSAMPADGCGALECPVSWSAATDDQLWVQPAVAGGVVYVGSLDGTVSAFDAAGCGAPTCAPLWSADAGAPVTGGLAVYNGRLYVGTAAALVGYALPAA